MIVLSVVLYVVVHVSRVTMVIDGSTFTEGGSEIRIALKGGGWTDAAKWGGTSGTAGAPCDTWTTFALREERREGDWEAGASGGTLVGRGGGIFTVSCDKIFSSAVSGSGKGGKGGLVGGESGSFAGAWACCIGLEVTLSSTGSRECSSLLSGDSYVTLTPVSRRASSGVRTTVAPDPNAVPVRDRMSIERTSFGSEMRTGFEAA